MLPKITIGVVLTILLLLIVYKLNLPPLSPTPPKLHPIAVELKWLHQSQFAGFYMAKEKGIYQKYGLDVTLNERKFDQQTPLKLVTNNKVDFAVVSGNELITAVSEGSKVKALAAILQDSPATIVSLEDNTSFNPSDLKEKNLGITNDNISGKLVYKTLLANFGIEEKDVNYKLVNAEQVKNLIEKKVDVVSIYRTSDTYLLEKPGIKYSYFAPEQYGIRTYDDVLITSERLINQSPDIVAKFVKATIEGWTLALNNIEEAVNISLEYSKGSKYQDRDFQKYILEKSSLLIKPSGGQKIGSMNFTRWKQSYDQLEKNGLIKNHFDIQELYTTKFLEY